MPDTLIGKSFLLRIGVRFVTSQVSNLLNSFSFLIRFRSYYSRKKITSFVSRALSSYRISAERTRERERERESGIETYRQI